MIMALMKIPFMGSNRTFMELKFVHGRSDDACIHSSNRTFMELK